MPVSSKSVSTALAAAVFCLLGTTQASAADAVCSGTLSGTYDNVFVNGGSCTLSNAVVHGNVTVTSGGALTMSGTTQISGDIQGLGAGNLALNSGVVSGAVSVLNSLNVTVGPAATLNALNLTNSGNATLRGILEKVTAIGSGSINVSDARVAAGIFVEGGKAGMTICGAAAIAGGVIMTGTTGGLSIGIGSTCAVTSITGEILVTKGTGAVRISNASMLASDVSVSEQSGNVILTNLSLSDISIEKLTGSVTLTGIATDSDSTFNEITGTVSISGGNFQGDVGIEVAQAVTISGNNFNNEDLHISKGTGSLTISKNINIHVNISERGTISFSGNQFDSALFSKNGALSVVGNTGNLIDCVDNTPAPTGSGNSITTKLGQCSGL